MTFQTEIEAALAKPVDKDAYKLSGQLCEQFGADAVSYALLLRIRDLEAQVEQERWLDIKVHRPAQSERGLLLYSKATGIYVGWYDRGMDMFQRDYAYEVPTHWKPINLPA